MGFAKEINTRQIKEIVILRNSHPGIPCEKREILTLLIQQFIGAVKLGSKWYYASEGTTLPQQIYVERHRNIMKLPSYQDAKMKCEEIGMRLVTIKSEQEQRYVVTLTEERIKGIYEVLITN